jgi:GxxExxY protein
MFFVDLKAVQEMTNVFEAQLLTSMKLLKSPKGILINFNCFNILQQGQKTYINEYFYFLPKD